MRTPGIGCPSASRTGTTKACTPCVSPCVISWAKTTATRPSRAALPMYSLRADSSGVVMTNSSVAGSNVAVVRREATSEP